MVNNNKNFIEAIKQMIQDGCLSQDDAEKYFPELKESEDERIRKELIEFVKSRGGFKQEYIAWLEKQGEQKPVEEAMKEVVKDKDTAIKFLMSAGIINENGELSEECRSEECEATYKFDVGEWVIKDNYSAQYVKEVRKGAYVLDGSISGVETLPIKYVDDNYHLWTIYDAKPGDVLSYRDGQWIFIYKGIVTEDTFKYHALLSESGISVNDAAFSLLPSCIKPATKEDCDRLVKKMHEEGFAWDADKLELKRIDKVEPKFKVEKDKWYVCTSQYCNCIEGRNYKASLDGRIIDDYGTEYDMHNDAYRWFRPWTIKDAKDGDVLATLDYILVFKEFLKNDGGISYCHYDFGAGNPQFIWFEDKGWYFGKEAIIHPATKEQRDLLFQKMKEAGYEWDAEHKQLRKIENEIEIPFGAKDSELQEAIYFIPQGFHAEIEGNNVIIKKGEQNTAWSEEDKKMSRFIGNAITADDSSVYLKNKGIEVIDAHVWLNELKERVQPQQEWSEEDKYLIYNIEQDYRGKLNDNPPESLRPYYNKVIHLLKSLRTQSTWKPSGEQIKAVEESIEFLGCTKKVREDLKSLCEQLKKLREE